MKHFVPVRHCSPLRLRLFASTGLLCAAAFALTACANPVEGIIASTSGAAGDAIVSELSGVDVQGLGSTEVPADLPKIVPLPDIAPQTALSQTSDGAKSWIIHFQEGANDQVFDELKAQAVKNGFTEETSSDVMNVMRMAVLQNEQYQLNMSLLGPSNEEQILQLMVMESN